MRKQVRARSRICVAALAFFSVACAPPGPVVVKAVVPAIPADTIAIPLDQLGLRTYHGLQGGLYSGGINVPAAEYQAIGIGHANAIKPLAVSGQPSGSGKIVLMSVGAAEVSAVWCSISSAPPCDSWTVAGKAVSDPTVNHSSLVIVNGAIPGGGNAKWSSASAADYKRIRDTRLAPLGLSEKQVQAIWMMLTDTTDVGAIVGALRSRYPNLQLLFVSSPPYGGYSPTGEPANYQAGFTIRLLIEAGLGNTAGAWMSWGPYLWSSDWPRAEFDSTGAGLSRSGRMRAAGMVFEFFRSSPITRCWFIVGGAC